MPAVADNTYILTTPDQRQFVPMENTAWTLRGILVDNAGVPIQASQLSSLRLWLHLRDDTAVPSGGINSVSNTDILNDGVRGTIGNGKAVVGATINTAQDDYYGRVRLQITAHGYNAGDFIGIRGIRGIKGANGDWFIDVVGVDHVELIGSSGTGAYLSGGTATRGLQVQLQPADNAIVDTATAIGSTEWHEAYVLATYGGGKTAAFLFHFQVTNLGKAT
ncbi:MAG: hypothetical protein OEY77_00260 [Nitrospira sp.]|nr:hypothetical protein [Nitrospira sp.]